MASRGLSGIGEDPTSYHALNLFNVRLWNHTCCSNRRFGDVCPIWPSNKCTCM